MDATLRRSPYVTNKENASVVTLTPNAESVREACQAGVLLVMRILANSVSGQWTGGSTGLGMTLTQY